LCPLRVKISVQTTSIVKDSLYQIPLDVSGLIERYKHAAPKHGFSLEIFGHQGAYPLIGLRKRSTGVKPRIYLSSGIHGDEPASALTLLYLLERGFFDSKAGWFLCPVLNPEGLKLGTRESPNKADLNRAYKIPSEPETKAHVNWLKRQPNFNLSICLHEDWEAKGFYLYEYNPYKRTSLATPILDAVKVHSPIDLSPLIDDAEAKGGIIRPDPNPEIRELWAESIYLLTKHHVELHYTLETASGLALELRIATMEAAIRASIDAFKSVHV
jgi:hypothetical protein